jgi:SAM-dependent methyltransferase
VSEREQLRGIFDEDAELYDRARPGYPEALVDDLVALAGLVAGARVLEIGPGTGKLTIPLARRGLHVPGVELGPGLAAVARRNLEGFDTVDIVTGAFESWDPGEQRFDVVVAATCWHWLDPDLRYERAANALREGGALAIVTTEHVLPDDGDQFFNDIQDVYVDIGEGHPDGGPPHPDRVHDLRDDISASGRFDRVEVRHYVWEQAYTAEEYISVLETYSGHRSMTRRQRERLYGEIRRRLAARPDGRARKHYLNSLHVAHGLS